MKEEETTDGLLSSRVPITLRVKPFDDGQVLQLVIGSEVGGTLRTAKGQETISDEPSKPSRLCHSERSRRISENSKERNKPNINPLKERNQENVKHWKEKNLKNKLLTKPILKTKDYEKVYAFCSRSKCSTCRLRERREDGDDF